MIKIFIIILALSNTIYTISRCSTANSANSKCYVADHNSCYYVDSNYNVQYQSGCNDYCQMNDAQLDCTICDYGRRYSGKRCYSSPSANNGYCYNHLDSYYQTSYQAKCNPNCWAFCDECTYYNNHYHCKYCNGNLGNQLYSTSSRNCYNVTTVSNCWVIEDNSNCKICNDNYIMNQDNQTCAQVDTSISNCLNFDHFQCTICKENFQYNRNYYAVMFDGPSLNSQTDYNYLQDFIHTSYRMKNKFVDQCEPITTIQDCVVYLTGIKCKLCDKTKGLIPSSDMLSCVDPFRLFVEFCEIYNIEQVGCKLCLQGYYLLNGLCKRVDDVSNCILYELNTCVKCLTTHKLVNGSCTLRTTISNCIEYEVSEDYCTQCISNYEVTQDKLNCTYNISNCKIHSRNFFNMSICVQCNDNYYVNTFNQCTYGSVSSCQIYKTNAQNQCEQCNNQYYLYSSTSCVYDPINNCSLHDYIKENVCTTCSMEYVLLQSYSSCQQITTISNCAEYEYSDKCKLCDDYYFLNTTKTQCNSIDPSETNCKQYNPTDKCVKCEDSYSIVNGVCILNNEYFESCNLSDFYGQLFNDYDCKSCNTDYAPVDLTDYYGCHSYDFMKQKGLTSPDVNCLKYGYDTNSLSFICQLCNDGFYIRNGVCINQCEAGELLFKYTITKVQIPFTLDYNFIKYSGSNICGSLVDSEQNCIQVVPDVFFQSTDYRKVNYSCIECASNTLKIPKVKSVVSEYTPDINTIDGRFSKNPLRIFPGVSCKDKSNIKLEGVLSSGLIDGCEYYVELGFNNETGDTSYGCLKCQFGKNGIIERHKSSNRGYIKECKDFELPESELNSLDGVCNTAKFMFGFTHNSNDINWNQVPLETYLSCHDCISPSFPFYLFLFISFEDISKFSIGTQFSYKKNNMKNHAMLLDYHMPNDPQAGRTLRCLTFDLDKMFNFDDPIPDTIKSSMFFTDYLTKCQLFIVNTLKYKYTLNTYKPNPEILKEIIYCGACKPGFKAVTFSPLESGESEIQDKEYFLPYKIFDCIEISNCNNTTGNWVNNCEFCKEDYTWYWNHTLKTIEYNKCIFNNHSNCMAVDDNGLCQVCKKGFEFLDGTCVMFIGNKCEDTETLFVRDFPVNSNFVDFARNYFYFRDKTRGCNKCENDTALNDNLRYVSFINIPATLNRTQRIHCLTNCSNQCDKDSSLWDRITFIPDCKFYKYIRLSDYNNYGEEQIKIKCYECETNFVLNSIQECISATGFDNCYMVDIDTNTCMQCNDGYYFENSNCILPNIDNCIQYDNYPSSSTLICSKCDDNYYLNTTNNSCVSGSIPNCRVYESQTMCEICNDDYQNYKIGTIKTECIQLRSEFNCLKLNAEQFLENNFSCQKCISNYMPYVSYNTEPTETMCFEHPSVTNCLKYDVKDKIKDSTFQCQECSTNYYLDVATNTCISRTANYTYCNIRIIDEDKCELCQIGYSLAADQRSCVANEIQISGCAVYYRERYCLECQDRYYLENNECIFVETSDAIINCIRYEKTTSIKCSRCAPLYFLDSNDGQCKVGLVSNCDELTNKTNCKYCMENFQVYLKPNADPNLQGTYECKLLETATNRPLNCEISDIEQPSTCSTCIDNAYVLNGVCTLVPTGNRVNNCLKYELNSSNVIVCYLCDEGYYKYWVTDKYTCVQSSAQSLQPAAVHNNCRQLKKFDTAQCNSCPLGYHFDWDNNFSTCVSNSSSNCSIIRERDPGQCNTCANGYSHNGSSCS